MRMYRIWSDGWWNRFVEKPMSLLGFILVFRLRRASSLLTARCLLGHFMLKVMLFLSRSTRRLQRLFAFAYTLLALLHVI